MLLRREALDNFEDGLIICFVFHNDLPCLDLCAHRWIPHTILPKIWPTSSRLKRLESVFEKSDCVKCAGCVSYVSIVLRLCLMNMVCLTDRTLSRRSLTPLAENAR